MATLHHSHPTDWRNVDALKVLGDRCVPGWKTQRVRYQREVAVLGVIATALWLFAIGCFLTALMKLMETN